MSDFWARERRMDCPWAEAKERARDFLLRLTWMGRISDDR